MRVDEWSVVTRKPNKSGLFSKRGGQCPALFSGKRGQCASVLSPNSSATTDVPVVPCVPDFHMKRVLCETDPRRKYQRRRKTEVRPTMHHGQRKLLMSAIEFLTQCDVDKQRQAIANETVVVYTGMSQDSHVECLMKLFPSLRFVLVDPVLPSKLETHPLVKIIPGHMTDDRAEQLYHSLRKRDVLFINDVRTSCPKDPDNRVKIEDDMHAQMKWYYLLKPRKSMLKFRLPYVEQESDCDACSTYVNGQVFLPIWGPQSTTECRLVVDGPNAATKSWKHIVVEEQMHWFNTEARRATYQHPVDMAGLQEEYDESYDSVAEVYVLFQYLTQVCGVKHRIELQSRTVALCREISQTLRAFDDIEGVPSLKEQIMHHVKRKTGFVLESP
jgi:cap2 methyltransferase